MERKRKETRRLRRRHASAWERKLRGIKSESEKKLGYSNALSSTDRGPVVV